MLSTAYEADNAVPCVGEVLNDALSADAAGMIWILAWLAQQPFNCHACVHYDNSTVGGFTAGVSQWSATWEYVKLRSNLGAMRHFLIAKGRSFECRRLKSHDNHPWSETVDAIAKAVALKVLLPPNLPRRVAHALNHSHSEHAWSACGSSLEFPHPYHWRATFQSEGPFHGFMPDVTCIHSEEVSSRESVTIQVTLASANVLTLGSGTKEQQERGLLDLGRIATLQAQCSLAHIHFLGLQESRTCGSVTRHSQSHFVFQSGSTTDNHRGCELWVDRHLSYGHGSNKQYRFQERHFHIISFDDRHLFVQVSAPHLSLRILAIHAPHEEASDCTPDQWWHFIEQKIMHRLPSLPLVILGDCTARLGSSVSEAVSNCGAELETACGTLLHSCMLDHGLCAPSTFHEFHDGDTTTWISAGGSPHRLDYVLLPKAWQAFQVRSYVQMDVGLALSRHDHFVAAVDVTFALKDSATKRSKGLRIDVKQCQDASKCQQFVGFLQQPLTIPWTCGIGVHAELLTHWLSQGAHHACFAAQMSA